MRRFTLKRPFSSWIEPIGFKSEVKIFNPITKQKSPLIIRDPPDVVYWYTCGPTVYDSAHIGHASSYVRIDILQRILRNYFNVNLVTAMNITDIDDKIIRRAHELQVDWNEVSTKYEAEFWDDLQALNVVKPDLLLHVTKNIPLIIKFIDRILASGKGYARDGSVYFRTQAFPRYGKLQAMPLPSPPSDVAAFKENEADFALWKASKPNEPFWTSPWGPGRPGWHIECSTLASKVFGGAINFHAGGLDLKFPHHENEEAQSCVYHNSHQWVDYWVHTGQLRLKGDQEKMSKSLKNTKSIQDLLSQHSSNHFRMLCMLSKYRSTIEFDDQTMNVARSTYDKLTTFVSDCDAYISGLKPAVSFDAEEVLRTVSETDSKVMNYLKDDLNTPKVVETLLSVASSTNKILNSTMADIEGESNVVTIHNVKSFISKSLEKFGFETTKKMKSDAGVFIQSLVDVRQKVRHVATEIKNKDLFKIGDEIRDKLKENGVEVKDHGKNSSWTCK